MRAKILRGAGLISLTEAAAKGIDRVRKPIWASAEDHFKLDIFDGELGPWIHLFAPFNKECNGRDPFDICVIQVDIGAPEYVPYAGPLPDSEPYRAKVAMYEGCLEEQCK